jgi:hypothetical protein
MDLPWIKDIQQDMGRHFLYMQKKRHGKKDNYYNSNINTSANTNVSKPINDVRKESRNAFVYVKSLCLKKLQRYEESNESYAFINTLVIKKKNQKLLRTLIGLILGKMSGNINMMLQAVETLLAAMTDIKPLELTQDSFLPYYVPGDGWLTDQVDKVIFYLLKRSFWKRFTKFHIK